MGDAVTTCATDFVELLGLGFEIEVILIILAAGFFLGWLWRKPRWKT